MSNAVASFNPYLNYVNFFFFFREGFLTSITKLVQKRVNAGSSPRDDPDLDFNMKKVILLMLYTSVNYGRDLLVAVMFQRGMRNVVSVVRNLQHQYIVNLSFYVVCAHHANNPLILYKCVCS